MKPTGVPHLDPLEFRRTAGLFATGVTVVAAEDGDSIHGMTANAVASLSLDPMLMLVCVNKDAKLVEYLERAGGFSISILRHDQKPLSIYFAGLWDEPEPPHFRFVPWEGGPRLEGCAAAIGCELLELLQGGDHWIVVGRVLSLHRNSEPFNPLLFFRGKYARIQARARREAPDLGWVERPRHIPCKPERGDEV